MTSMRKDLVRIALLAVSLFGVANCNALAQSEYPVRPIRLIVGYAAGGLTDVMTRMLGERMSRELGQPIIVENRPGAAAALAATYVAQSEPDGYAVLMGTTSLAINPGLQPSLTPRNPMTDLDPVGIAYESPFVLLTSKNVPARSLAEFIAMQRQNLASSTLPVPETAPSII